MPSSCLGTIPPTASAPDHSDALPREPGASERHPSHRSDAPLVARPIGKTRGDGDDVLGFCRGRRGRARCRAGEGSSTNDDD
mmetsp:Transcript_836/g.1990  ORF Transcript_836/g.1990 Transcript_836/m.1990 type:complete len:82 (-) Transcript_836:210-455(-)